MHVIYILMQEWPETRKSVRLFCVFDPENLCIARVRSLVVMVPVYQVS